MVNPTETAFDLKDPEAWKAALDHRIEEGLQEYATDQAGVDTLRVSTHEPFAKTFQRFFETRRRRR